MKDFIIFFIWSFIVCLAIMVLTIDLYKKKIEPSESAWFRLHGKKITWVFGFIVNLFMIYILIFVYEVYIGRSFIQSNKTDNIITDSIQNDTIIVNNKDSSGRFITHVTLTTYNPVEEQCDADPLITADGTKIDLHKLKKGKIRYCAISRNLLPFIPLGSVIEIEGYGLYEVRDTMNKRFSHRIDILQHMDEKNFKKTGVKIIKIK